MKRVQERSMRDFRTGYLSPWAGEDFGVNKVKFSRSPL